jgi:hypothetical protein
MEVVSIFVSWCLTWSSRIRELTGLLHWRGRTKELISDQSGDIELAFHQFSEEVELIAISSEKWGQSCLEWGQSISAITDRCKNWARYFTQMLIMITVGNIGFRGTSQDINAWSIVHSGGTDRHHQFFRAGVSWGFHKKFGILCGITFMINLTAESLCGTEENLDCSRCRHLVKRIRPVLCIGSVNEADISSSLWKYHFNAWFNLVLEISLKAIEISLSHRPPFQYRAHLNPRKLFEGQSIDDRDRQICSDSEELPRFEL